MPKKKPARPSKPAARPQASPSKPPAAPSNRKSKPAFKTVVRPGRCLCGSTRRTGYTSIVTRELNGAIDGHPYTHIVWKRTRCSDCGQTRVDLFHENRPKESSKSKPKSKGTRKR